MKALILYLLLLLSLAASAQDQSKNSYRFAQTYVGYKTSYLNHFGSQTVAPHLNQNLTMGGLHFWGKADFYVTFPVGISALGNESDFHYSEGVQTGGRWMPFGLSSKSPRPYFGAHWSNPSISTESGAYYSQASLGLEPGLVIVVKKSWSLELGAHFTVANSFNYYTSRTTSENVQVPYAGFDFGVKKYFDFTRSLEKESSQKFLAETYVEMKNKKHLNAWELAAGPSSSIPLTELGYLEGIDWLPNKPLIAINPDFGFGFYFHKPDIVVRTTYRPITKLTSGHDLDAQFRENRLSLEGFKFLFNYHGFVPFVGLGLNYNRYSFITKDKKLNTRVEESGVAYSASIVFGWDIRPSEVEWFILRTNLRYQPRGNMSGEHMKYFSNDLEFNFIQMVVYPERMNYYFGK